MKRIAVIMAGGSGERFWPVSRKNKPKQLLKLTSDKSMIEESIERISSLIKPEDIYIITSETLLEQIRSAAPKVAPENVIAEPRKRNTAPCLALSAAFISAKYSGKYKPEEISIAVLTADQSIEPRAGFEQTVNAALSYVEKRKALCVIGIMPDRPETGYGYIEIEGEYANRSEEAEVRVVKAFHEKPDKEKARKYIEAGNYLWNSGMFFWRLDTFIEKISMHLPEVGDKLDELKQKYEGKTDITLPGALASIGDIYYSLPDISIDYGLMERSDDIVAVKAQFNWDDIGSWDSLQRVRESDDNNNILEGKNVLIDVNNSIIINSAKNKEVLIAGIGLEDMVVVVTDDAVLICPKDRTQDVKQCVNIINKTSNEK